MWKHFNPDSFRNRLRNIDWTPLYSSNDIKTVNDYFIEQVGSALEEEAPLKFVQSRKNYCNWVNDTMLDQMKERDQARQTARTTDTHEDWSKYRRLKNDCTKNLKQCKNTYFKNIFEAFSQAGDSKNIYRTAKKIMGWYVPLQPKMFLARGTIFRKPVQMANELQKFYVKKVENLMGGLEKGGCDPLRFLKGALMRWEESESSRTFSLRKVTTLETLNFIKKTG